MVRSQRIRSPVRGPRAVPVGAGALLSPREEVLLAEEVGAGLLVEETLEVDDDDSGGEVGSGGDDDSGGDGGGVSSLPPGRHWLSVRED